ncbi:hypothetical protein KM043_014862 [Ampulex compressa]|nr:hypothetical protein KM043_014862 [Ampulex compressa]
MYLDNLFHDIYLNNEETDREQLQINIWTLVSINPEPLLLQILSADKGWPVPKYLGACGRVVVEEYVGSPLSTYYNAPWTERARIASSLLNAAYMFTFRKNIIVVAKNSSGRENSSQWHELGQNKADFDCLNCLAYSAEDICNHKINDHNYYAICRLLLSLETTEASMPGGLLHEIPPYILEQHSNITYLIQQCVVPEALNDRIIAGQQLKKIIDTILET